MIGGHSSHFAEVMGVGKGSRRGRKGLVTLLGERGEGKESVMGRRAREGRRGEYRLQSEARMFGRLNVEPRCGMH